MDPLAKIVQDFHAYEITEYYKDFEKRFHGLFFSYCMLLCAAPPRKMDHSRDLNVPCSLDGGLTQEMLQMVVESCHCKRTKISMIFSHHLNNNKIVISFLLESLYS
jgi:hypothetical protein